MKKNNRDIKTLEDLEEKTVAAVKDTNAYYGLESIGLGLSRMGCTDIDQVMAQLESGEADAAVMTVEEASGLSGVKVLEDRLDYNTYAVACRTEDTVLRDLIQYGIAQVTQN